MRKRRLLKEVKGKEEQDRMKKRFRSDEEIIIDKNVGAVILRTERGTNARQFFRHGKSKASKFTRIRTSA